MHFLNLPVDIYFAIAKQLGEESGITKAIQVVASIRSWMRFCNYSVQQCSGA